MHRVGFIFLFVALLFSCDSQRKFDEYKTIDVNGWSKDDLVVFEFDINDTIASNNLFINIRNTNEYLYNNIFVIAEMDYPNGLSVIDTLEYEMADLHGKWLGSGFTDVKENKLFYREDFVFPNSGTYKVQIQQAMRKRNEVSGIEYLKGISNVGFRVEDQK
jgi:gliding motility-associated lipoprotein GldH